MARTDQSGKTINWPRLATWFDLSSSPNDIPWGRWRYVLNMQSADGGKFQRACGFRRYGHDLRVKKNTDLNTRDDDSPLTSLYSHVSPRNYTRLFAASSTQVYSQFFDGRWRCLGDFTAGSRFQFASLNDAILVTNDADKPKLHVDGDRTVDGQAFHSIDSLDAIDLTKAAVTWSWKGVLFLADVEMGGTRVTNRLIWSDANDPTQWSPVDGTIAGFQDLSPGERILAGLPLSDALFIFTSHGIWRAITTGDAAAFGFQQVYYSKTGEGCLIGRNAIASWRDLAIYRSREGLMFFSPYGGAPEQPPWLSQISENLNASPLDKCNLVTAAYNPDRDEFWISYPTEFADYPDRTLVVNMGQQSASELDHGFHAMLHANIDQQEDVSEWMIRVLGCSSFHIDELWQRDREDIRPAFEGRDVNMNTLCASNDFLPQCPNCMPQPRFLMVSTQDGLIKQLEEDYFAREIKSGKNYIATGYESRAITGCLDFDKDDWKRLSQVSVDFIAAPEAQPRDLGLTITVSGTPVDPLNPGCSVKSFQMTPKKLRCPEPSPSAGSHPSSHAWWNLMLDSRYFILDFHVPAVTGGEFTLSTLSVMVAKSPANTT